jgi:hypothetical protein
MKQIKSVRCTHVIAQVCLGCYDENGNLVGEAMFPQVEGSAVPAKLFHPHDQELTHLIAACIEQGWEKLQTQGLAEAPMQLRDLSELLEVTSGESEP